MNTKRTFLITPFLSLIALLAILALALSACQSVQPLTEPTTNSSSSSPTSTVFTPTEVVTNSTPAGQGTGEPGVIHCLVEFEATVRQGPSSGVMLKGMFDFKVDETGTLGGKLLQDNQGEILAAGQVNGHAIHLVFFVGEGKYIFGVGTTVSKITNESCGMAFGGPFVGPGEGDAGDWLVISADGSPGSTPGGLPDVQPK